MPCEETRIARAIFSRQPASLRKCCPSFCLAMKVCFVSLSGVSRGAASRDDLTKDLCGNKAGRRCWWIIMLLLICRRLIIRPEGTGHDERACRRI